MENLALHGMEFIYYILCTYNILFLMNFFCSTVVPLIHRDLKQKGQSILKCTKCYISQQKYSPSTPSPQPPVYEVVFKIIFNVDFVVQSRLQCPSNMKKQQKFIKKTLGETHCLTLNQMWEFQWNQSITNSVNAGTKKGMFWFDKFCMSAISVQWVSLLHGFLVVVV